MPTHADQWSEVSVAGHLCRVFEPTLPSPHGYTILYLHGSHLENLAHHPRITQQFERHGLRVMAPMTGTTWWSDRIAVEFDQELTVEKYLREHVMPYIKEHWQVEPPRIALLGVSMGGQARCDSRISIPTPSPLWRPCSRRSISTRKSKKATLCSPACTAMPKMADRTRQRCTFIP